MDTSLLTISGLLAQVNGYLRATWRDVEVEGEIAEVRDPDASTNPSQAARFINAEVVDVGAERRIGRGLKVTYRLGRNDPPGLREDLKPGTTVRVRGRLQLFGRQVELDARRLQPMGISLTRDEYDRVAARTDWAPAPPVSPAVRRMTVFGVRATSQADLERWTTSLVPEITWIPVAGDDPSLITTVRDHLPDLLADPPDLVVFMRGGTVPDLSIWSSQALCETVDAIQQAGIPVAAAVGHKEHRPLIYNVVCWAIDHPIAVATDISQHNHRLFDTRQDTRRAMHALGERLDSAQSRRQRTVAATRQRLARLLAHRGEQAAEHHDTARARLGRRPGQALEQASSRASTARLARLLDHRARQAQRWDATARSRLQQRTEQHGEHVRRIDEQTSQRLRRMLDQAAEDSATHDRNTRARLEQALERAAHTVKIIEGRFEDLDGRAALLSDPDGGPAHLQPGAQVMLDLLDRRVRVTVDQVSLRPTNPNESHKE